MNSVRPIRMYLLSLVAAVLTLATIACNSGHDSELTLAEQHIGDNPEQSLSILNSINPDSLDGDQEKARCALLLTEAEYWNGTDETDDSLISVATEYYNGKESDPKRMKAFYYKGVVKRFARDYGDALMAFMQAEKTASRLNDHNMLGLIYRGFGDCFDNMNNPTTAIAYYNKSYKEFCADGPGNVYITDAIFDIARIHYNKVNYDSCLIVLQEALKIAEQKNDTSMICDAERLKSSAYADSRKYHEAIECIGRIMELDPSYPVFNHQVWNNLGTSYAMLGEIVKAQECLDSLKSHNYNCSFLSYLIAYNKGDYKIAADSLFASNEYNAKIYVKWISRHDEKAILDHYNLLEINSALEVETRNLWIGLIASVLFLTSLVFLIVTRNTRKKRQREIRENMEFAKNMRMELDKNEGALDKMWAQTERQNRELEEKIMEINKKDENIRHLESKTREQEITINETRERVSTLESRLKENERTLENRAKAIREAHEILKNSLHDQFGVLDELARGYYDSMNHPLGKKELYTSVKKIIDRIKEDNKVFMELENTVNSRLGNLMADFRKDFPLMQEKDVKLFLFITLDFSGKSISVFLDIPIDRVYNRKNALKKKIKASGNEIAEKYLQYL